LDEPTRLTGLLVVDSLGERWITTVCPVYGVGNPRATLIRRKKQRVELGMPRAISALLGRVHQRIGIVVTSLRGPLLPPDKRAVRCLHGEIRVGTRFASFGDAPEPWAGGLTPMFPSSRRCKVGRLRRLGLRLVDRRGVPTPINTQVPDLLKLNG